MNSNKMTQPKLNQSDRIAALEEGYKGLRNDISGLRGDFQLFAQEMRGSNKTQWAPIIAAAAVVIGIIGGLVTLGSYGPLNDLSRHNQEIIRIESTVRDLEKTVFTDAESERLEKDLHRDMEVLDQNNRDRTDRLDSILQREMRLLIKPLEEKTERLQDDIDRLRDKSEK